VEHRPDRFDEGCLMKGVVGGTPKITSVHELTGRLTDGVKTREVKGHLMKGVVGGTPKITSVHELTGRLTDGFKTRGQGTSEACRITI
jgi:hypothetical protein